ERIANIEGIDVDDTDRPALVRHDGADIGAALGAEQIVGNAEREAVARQVARRGAELDRARRIAHGARAVAAAEGTVAAADPHLLRRLVGGELDLHSAAVAGNGIDCHCAIKVALKSLTLVRVGPVTRLSPSISKKLWPSLSSSIALGSRPTAVARLSESGAKTAPAMSSAPSTPSVSAARPQMPAAPPAAITSASRYSTLRPPRPLPRTVTVVSPPDRITVGLPARLARSSV